MGQTGTRPSRLYSASRSVLGPRARRTRHLKARAALIGAAVGLLSAGMGFAQTVTPGLIAHKEDLVGVRYKSFANTPTREIYLGIPDLGVGANRTEVDVTWAATNDVTFTFDKVNDKLTATVVNTNGTFTVEYPNLAAQIIAKGKTYTLDDLDMMQISVANRDTGTTVDLVDAEIDGNSLGSFSGAPGGWSDWMVTDYDFTQGFTVTGTLQLAGTFGGNEVSKLEIKVGHDTCGNGDVEPPEQCDDGNTEDGDCCDPHCLFEASGAPCGDQGIECAENDECDGNGSCTDNGFWPESTPCTDTDEIPSTVAGCESGVCVQDHIVVVTTTTTTTATTSTTLTTTTTSATTTSTTTTTLPPTGCPSLPKETCRQPSVPLRALLLLRNMGDNSKDRLIWKWIKGEKTDFGDFGNPVTTDDYTLCIYEKAAESPSLLLTAPAGGQCAGRQCWKALSNSRGFKYKDRELTPNGLDMLLLKAGDVGRAKVILRGKGANLALPSPLDVELPVTVQLQSANGECWEAAYFSVGVKKNEADFFKAKAGSPSGAFVEMTPAVLD